MITAFVRPVSPKISECEISYVKRLPINHEAAAQQHVDYCAALTDLGVNVVSLTGSDSHPDATFVEDTAVVLDEIAVITRMGVASRSGEQDAVAKALAGHRTLEYIKAPATLEGGDVIQMGSTLFVGQTKRTNDLGIAALRKIVSEFGYEVVPVAVKDCLHLKTACTALSSRSLLVNPEWLDIGALAELNVVTVDEDEPNAANVVRVGQTVCVQPSFPKTNQLLAELDFRLKQIDISELSRAEAGLSCLSILFQT